MFPEHIKLIAHLLAEAIKLLFKLVKSFKYTLTVSSPDLNYTYWLWAIPNCKAFINPSSYNIKLTLRTNLAKLLLFVIIFLLTAFKNRREIYEVFRRKRGNS